MEQLRTTKTCLNCHKTLAGRRDKKFCDNQCKAEYHNQNKSFGELYISEIQRITRSNRKILKTLSPEGKATVRKEILEQMGYDFNHFSGIYKSKQLIYYLVYDYAFAPTTDSKGIQKAIIVQRQDYMNQLGFPIWKT